MQSIDYDLSTVETFTTNTAALVDAVGETFPDTNTPLAESLYDFIRYIAQINSAYYPSKYVYPIAFSGAGSDGKNFQYSGSGPIGSIGASEVSALIGGESCPSGYITNACGRDPYSLRRQPYAGLGQYVSSSQLLQDLRHRPYGRRTDIRSEHSFRELPFRFERTMRTTAT